MKIEMFLDKKGKPRLRIRARNGKIVMSSEAYKTKRKQDQKRSAKETAYSIWNQIRCMIFEDIFKDLTEEK